MIVIARGGDSVQDLAVFDHEGLCRAIRAVDTPVITAIGHTQNNPVCNHITHAAFVPRHAAELVVADRGELLAEVDGAAQAMNRAARELRRTNAEFELAAGTLSDSRRLQALRAELLDAGNVIAKRAGSYLHDGEELLHRARDELVELLKRGKGLELVLRAHLDEVEQQVSKIESGDSYTAYRIVPSAPDPTSAQPAPRAQQHEPLPPATSPSTPAISSPRQVGRPTTTSRSDRTAGYRSKSRLPGLDRRRLGKASASKFGELRVSVRGLQQPCG